MIPILDEEPEITLRRQHSPNFAKTEREDKTVFKSPEEDVDGSSGKRTSGLPGHTTKTWNGKDNGEASEDSN